MDGGRGAEVEEKKVKGTSPESARLGTVKMSCRNPVVRLAYGVSAKFEKCFLHNRRRKGFIVITYVFVRIFRNVPQARDSFLVTT